MAVDQVGAAPAPALVGHELHLGGLGVAGIEHGTGDGLMEAHVCEVHFMLSSNGALTQVPDGGHTWTLPDAMVYQPSTDSFIIGDGSDLFSLPRTGGTVQQVGSGFGLISGLTFDDVGRLYVADRTNHVIWQVVPEPGTSLSLIAVGVVGLIRRRRFVAA